MDCSQESSEALRGLEEVMRHIKDPGTSVDEKHAFVIAGTRSGCGKTTLSLGIMAALKARGWSVQPFKVGPDFIDPGFHTQVAGRQSRNLDGWMLGRAANRSLFERLLDQADVAVVEGVMGLFDGYDGVSESGSSAEIAKWLDLPVVLVVDAGSMARSAAALVYGFSRFDSGLKVAGVIFNKIGGKGHLEYLKEAMSANLPEIPVLGGIPREDPIRIPERHLGLVTADEVFLDDRWRARLVQLVEEYVDLDLLIEKSCVRLEPRSREAPGIQNLPVPTVPIAVARDAAFCFYYPDNLELLRQAGALLHFFSPLAGENFPRESAGLYLGGGYPELYAKEISERKAFIESVIKAAQNGMPIHAECGGLMVLSRFIETIGGERCSMAGLLPFGTRMLKRRKALGYTEVVLSVPCLLGKAGMVLRGHEFHYSEVVEEERDPRLTLAYRLRMRRHEGERMEGYLTGSVLASYVHLHWGSAPEAAENFVMSCRHWMNRAEQ